jgi:hypothetical protein
MISTKVGPEYKWNFGLWFTPAIWFHLLCKIRCLQIYACWPIYTDFSKSKNLGQFFRFASIFFAYKSKLVPFLNAGNEPALFHSLWFQLDNTSASFYISHNGSLWIAWIVCHIMLQANLLLTRLGWKEIHVVQLSTGKIKVISNIQIFWTWDHLFIKLLHK